MKKFFALMCAVVLMGIGTTYAMAGAPEVGDKSKAISSRASPPIFITDSTMPRPKAAWLTISPLFSSR